MGDKNPKKQKKKKQEKKTAPIEEALPLVPKMDTRSGRQK